MGGVGSGNWYRFDKKATTAECHSVDVRYLHREGLGVLVIAISFCLVPLGFWQGPERHDLRVLRVI